MIEKTSRQSKFYLEEKLYNKYILNLFESYIWGTSGFILQFRTQKTLLN